MIHFNPISKAQYTGSNEAALQQALEENGYSAGCWVTFRQMADNGGAFNQPAKGKGIRLFRVIVEPEKGGKRRKGFSVFNCDLIDWKAKPETTAAEAKPITAEETLSKFGDLSESVIVRAPENDMTDSAGRVVAQAYEQNTSSEREAQIKSRTADKLRTLADNLQAQIDDKFADRQTNTAKRLGQAMSARFEGERLQRTQQVMRVLADQWESGTPDPLIAGFNTKKAIYERMGEKSTHAQNGFHSYPVGNGEPRLDDPKTLALWALLKPKSEEQKQAEELQREVEHLQFTDIPGHFATKNKELQHRMIDAADIWAGMEVLEPSCGEGELLDAIQALAGVKATGVEINSTLADISHKKGHQVVCCDFLTLGQSGDVDRVIMNPPFENQQDIDHVRHAFGFLGELGRLVAIMSPSWQTRDNAKSREFREWLQQFDHTVEAIPAGAFKKSGTNVHTVMLVIDAPSEAQHREPAPEAADIPAPEQFTAASPEPVEEMPSSLEDLFNSL